MKYILHVLFACLLACDMAQAQEKPAKAFIGGTVNYLSYRYKDDNGQGAAYNDVSNFRIGLQPYLGFWLNAHWALGLKAGIDFDRQSFDGISNPAGRAFTKNTYSVGFFGRRYFGKEKPLRLFLEPSVRYAFFTFGSKKEQPVFGTVTASKEFSGGVAPGIA